MPSTDETGSMKSWFQGIKEFWPILVFVMASMVAWGTLQQRVQTLELQMRTAQADHDILIEVRTETKAINARLDMLMREQAKDK